MPFFRDKHHDRDPIWHVECIVLAAVVLQFALPDRFVLGVHWLLPALEILLAALLAATTPKQRVFQSLKRRINVVLLLAAVGLGNLYALTQVVHQLLQQGRVQNGRELILTAINLYLTNVIVFALLYWEMDGGGPGSRRAARDVERDFLFPQSSLTALKQWHPTSLDYLYVSSTNATAFSPTDTLPLSRRAKMLMLVQSIISLVVVALVAARAVNILN
ncbi:MAG TPA: hypothetical protein VLF69_05845 [Candidatus Saccharimonadales bacterium]|nr:hypothetical protein [Candidatus Saccharimonadales bacterium]